MQSRKPITHEEFVQWLKEGQAEHEEKMKTDPEYCELWTKREKSFDKLFAPLIGENEEN